MRSLLLFILFFSIKTGLAQTNVVAIHQLVSQNKDEFKLQETARNNQAVINSSEVANKTLLNKLHVKYEDIQQRYSLLGSAIDVARIGISADPIVKNIIANQKIIINEAVNDPVLLLIAFESEKKFVDRGEMLIRYLTGLMVGIGDVYSLKPSDRYILFSHITDELYILDQITRNLAVSMQFHNKYSLLKKMNPLDNFISKDKQIVNEIMSNWELLKK